MFKFFCLFFTVILILSCRERDRNNPFDPHNDDEFIELGLSLHSTDSLITLSWNIPLKPDFSSFEIYKKEEGQDDFTLLANISNTVSHYNDIINTLDIRYYYYIKLIGKGVESPPTKTKSIVPGPGSIWMLDDYLWEILKLNYDLSSTALRKVGVWKPENLTFAHEINRGLITYPIFNYYEIFDLSSGNILYGNQAIVRPFDAVYDNGLNRFWLIDSLGSLYIVDSTANEQFAGKFFKKPVQIDMLDDQLVILDKIMNGIYLFDRSPAQVDFISTNGNDEPFANLDLFRVDQLNKKVYLLDRLKDNNTLYKYNVEKNHLSVVFQDSLIRTFDVNKQDESIWIIIANKLNSELLQLSSTGQRLVSIKGFNLPRDVKVNPYNGNVIVADITDQLNILEQKVFHYRSNTLIGSFRTYGDPFKVYIE